jgi:hypothetical protein
MIWCGLGAYAVHCCSLWCIPVWTKLERFMAKAVGDGDGTGRASKPSSGGYIVDGGWRF